MTFLTDFADQAVLLPLALIVALCLAILGWWRGVAAWLFGVGATLATMLLLKIAFISCGPDYILRSPSGHTAAAAVIVGGLTAVIGGGSRLGVLAAALAALLIGGSRLALGVHTPLEILVGAAIGIGGALVTAQLAGPTPEIRRNRVAVAALLVLVLLHGMHMPAEAHIRNFANRVAQYFPACHAS